MSKKEKIPERWRDVIKEVNLKAGEELLDPNETNIELIQEVAYKHLQSLASEEVEVVIPMDSEIDFEIDI